jgi:hypothetical protein
LWLLAQYVCFVRALQMKSVYQLAFHTGLYRCALLDCADATLRANGVAGEGFDPF